MRLEQIIASSCRQKILLALSRIKTTHVTNLVRIINSTYNQVNRNLLILERENIIKTKHYGHIKMIELNIENPKTQTLLRALHMLERPIQTNKNNFSQKIAIGNPGEIQTLIREKTKLV